MAPSQLLVFNVGFAHDGCQNITPTTLAKLPLKNRLILSVNVSQQKTFYLMTA
jgi:hypothetical protein